MFRKLTPVFAIAISLGAASAPAFAQTGRHDMTPPPRHDRVSGYAVALSDHARASEGHALAPSWTLGNASCELEGYPDCH